MEEMNDVIVIEPEVPDPSEIAAEKKSVRRAFSRCGWSTFALTASVFALTWIFFAFVVEPIDRAGVDVWTFYTKNSLYINEVLIALAIFIGAIVLFRAPKTVPDKNKISPKHVVGIVFICFGVAWVGNIIGNAFILFWNSVTGNNVTNEIADILTNIDPLQMIVCTVVLAPVLEELFFRKLLIDRLYRFGEFPAIVISALLFGLFHQNFSQFFYAFGVGLVLGYLYCKTGRYSIVVGLHAVFNLIGGAIPSLFTPKVLEFAEKMTELSAEAETEAILSLFSDYAVPLLLYFGYIMIFGALQITGLVLFIINFKKIVIKPSDTCLSKKETCKAIFLNVGMLAAIALLAFLTIRSLLPAGPI